jgi:putative two-component system response regulator
MKKQTILVVDDTPDNLDMLNSILSSKYRVKAVTSGQKALDVAATPEDLPDLILLDVMMPGMDGYEVLRQLKTSDLTRKIPVIFISALNEPANESKGLEIGAVDYISKPVVAPIVLARVRTHLALYDTKMALEEKVRARTEELIHTQDVTMLGFATLAEFRNKETGAHIMRTQQFVRILAQYIMVNPRFAPYLNMETITILYKSAPLHDIGKIAVPDRILLKPGKLTADEFEEMKLHTVYGRDAILKAEQALGNVKNSFLALAKEIAYTHHEKWDGSGYPEGTSGDDIPISGRLMALADVYDALTSKRVYKEAFFHEKAVEIIQADRGKHFDPDVVDAFLDIEDIFRNIAQNTTDLGTNNFHES